MHDFILLVKAMRQAQQDYFKNRHKQDLIKAKNLEKAVDSYLKNVTDEPQKKNDYERENDF